MDRTERRLSELSDIPPSAVSQEHEDLIRSALSDRSGAVAARAAKLAASRALDALVPDLADRLEALLDAPASRDKGCLAKEALVDALAELGYKGPEPYLSAAQHVQMEAVYGGRVDTAGELRAAAASALFRTGYRDILFVVTPMLTDTEPSPRRAAVDALGKLGSESCELLLRMKVLTGDEDESIVASCFSALMDVAPGRSFDFVAGFLSDQDDAVAQGAALALGESRADGAFRALKQAWDARVGEPFRDALLLPMALTREDEAWSFLLPVLQEGPPERAAEALHALKLFDDWADRRDRMRAIVKKRNEELLRQAWFTEFGEELGE
jgi:HEAT repeat protein